MGKKKKIENNPSENSSLEKDSVTSIVTKDNTNISEAVEKAETTIDSVAYADNLVKPTNKNKNKKNTVKNDDAQETTKNTSTDLIDLNTSSNNLKQERVKTAIILLCIGLFIILLVTIFSVIFALIVRNQETIIQGVKIKNIDVSGLTKETAISKISTSFNENLSDYYTLKYNDYETNISAEQLNIYFDIENCINNAYSKGRDENIFKSNFEILTSLLFTTNIDPNISYNDDAFNSLIVDINTNLPDRFIESSYYIDGNNLILSKGKNGICVDSDALKTSILNSINNFNDNNLVITIPVIYKTTSPIDLNKVYNEIHRDAQNAYYTTEPCTIYPQVDGIDFDISMEEANNILNTSENDCSIPLRIIEPDVTTKDLGFEAFPDLLGSFSTKFSTSNYNRSTNIRIAASKIDGIVIMPEEIFSYNQTVGKRTTAAGFRTAAVYSGGEVTTGIGGGICQVSSTLYNAVLYANLDIVERQNHGFNPGYVAAGRDATVSWGSPDFKFQNNRSYPVKISASVNGGTINIEVYGLHMEDEPEVEIQSYITQYIPYKTITKEDPSLEAGDSKVIESGSSGCRAVCYRILKRNGEVISKTLLSQDTYSPHNRIVAVSAE